MENGSTNYKKIYLEITREFREEIVIPKYEIIETVTDLEKYLQNVKDDKLFIDIETLGLSGRASNAKIVCLGLYGPGQDKVAILPFSHYEKSTNRFTQVAFIKTLLNYDFKWIGHNFKFDLNYLGNFFESEIDKFGLLKKYFADTMAMSYSIHGKTFGNSLGDCIEYYLNKRTHKDMVKDFLIRNKISRDRYDLVPLSILYPYLSADVYNTYLLYEEFMKIFNKKQNQSLKEFYFDFFQPTMINSLRLEWNGNKLDKTHISIVDQEINNEIKDILNILRQKYNLTETIINSPKQLLDYLNRNYSEHKDLIDSTKEETLKTLSNVCKEEKKECLNLILEYRHQQKRAKYIESFYKFSNENQGEYIHPSFNLTTTITGRMSSSDPNFQNIPFKDRVKYCIVSRFGDEGVLIQSDYKGAELRVLANLSGDESLINDLIDPAKDLHSINASMMFNVPLEKVDPILRKNAKSAFFALIYGATGKGVAALIGATPEEGQAIIDNFFNNRKKVGELDAYLKNKYLKGELPYIENLLKRRIYQNTGVILKDTQMQNVARKLLNYLVQSTSSDFCLLGLNKLQEEMDRRNMKSKIINFVHDSIIVDTHYTEIKDIILLLRKYQVEYINEKFNLILPLDNELEIGCNWYHLVEVNHYFNENQEFILDVTFDEKVIYETPLLSVLLKNGKIINKKEKSIEISLP
jgi:DNA polymerase-1